MTDQEVIALLESHINRILYRYGCKMPFHLDDMIKIKQFDRPYFNVFQAGNFKIVLDSDGQCTYIEYKEKRYYNWTDLKKAV